MKQFKQERIHSLSEMDGLLERVLHRLPGLMFDAFLPEHHQVPSPAERGQHWCTCGNYPQYPDMTTDIEKLCCRPSPQRFISEMTHMQYYTVLYIG